MLTVRHRLTFSLIALVGAFLITRGLVAAPGFTDAFYHLNAANRFAAGQGLTDPYLWTYIGAPDTLPAPSHLYWMPLTSLGMALGMKLLNQPGVYAAAQWPLTLMFAGTVMVAFWLGHKIGGSRRHAWVAGLLTLFAGYYTRFWGAADTFAPYALVGSLCLLFIGLALETEAKNRQTGYFALAGIFTALAHLTRADGVLLLFIGWVGILSRKRGAKALIGGGFIMTLVYLLTMTPWFVRNLNAIGTPMPLGGTQAIWFREYNDLFNYPPLSSPAALFADGLITLFASRWEAFTNNLGTFVAVEGLVVMTPLMLISLLKRRGQGFLQPFGWYALALHGVMTLVFPFPGYRGGLLHSAAALVPWWAALGVVGLDDAVDWIARRRRRWNPAAAKVIFSVGLVGLALLLSLYIALPNRVSQHETPLVYRALSEKLPPDTRVMINDPAQLYFYTELNGVVLPNESPEKILDIARKYNVDYLVLEGINADGQTSDAASPKLWPILISPPEFLIPLPFDIPGFRLYEIRH